MVNHVITSYSIHYTKLYDTFGFIAPILAIISVQDTMLTGLVFIVLFAVGHCIPIVIAGSSTAMVKRLLGNSSYRRCQRRNR